MDKNTPIKEIKNRVKTKIKDLKKALSKNDRLTSQIALRGSISALKDVLEWIQELD